MSSTYPQEWGCIFLCFMCVVVLMQWHTTCIILKVTFHHFHDFLLIIYADVLHWCRMPHCAFVIIIILYVMQCFLGRVLWMGLCIGISHRWSCMLWIDFLQVGFLSGWPVFPPDGGHQFEVLYQQHIRVPISQQPHGHDVLWFFFFCVCEWHGLIDEQWISRSCSVLLETDVLRFF